MSESDVKFGCGILLRGSGRTTWREKLEYALNENGESFTDIVSSTLTDEQLYKPFCDGYGRTEGDPFTVWTNDYVYFPLEYDGSESVGCAPRNPNGIALEHQ